MVGKVPSLGGMHMQFNYKIITTSFLMAVACTTATIALNNSQSSATDLKAARMSENPVALKHMLDHAKGKSAETKLSLAFLKSRSTEVSNAAQSLQEWIDHNPDAPADDRAFAFQQLGDRHMAATRYRQAAAAFRKAQSFDILADDPDLNDQAVLSEIAATVPPIARAGTPNGQVALEQDLAKLRRAPIKISGSTSPMIIDTGAEISVVAQSVAEKSQMAFLVGEVTVGTTTDNVSGRLAVSNDVNIGGMIFRNVLFLVLPDDQLTFADGQYFVDGIIGLPLFAKAGRMEWRDAASQLLLGDANAESNAKDAPIYWHEGGMALQVAYEQTARPAFFDSGASRSSGSPTFKELLSPKIKAMLLAEESTITGVGGTHAVKNYILPAGSLIIGGAKVLINDFKIAGEQREYPEGDMGVIGMDIVTRTQSFSVDFEAMTYQLELAKTPGQK